jgi:hypothetical protein
MLDDDEPMEADNGMDEDDNLSSASAVELRSHLILLVTPLLPL